jgi:hypothetical protein
VLAALGRWGEAHQLLLGAHAAAKTPWDRAAVAIAWAARANDRGHARQALALLEPLAGEPAVTTHARLTVSWTVEHLRALALQGRREVLSAARTADATVAELMRAGRRGPAARLGAWQAAAAWITDHTEDALMLADEAVGVLDRLGHRLWWAEAATTAVWIRRGAGGAASLPAPLIAFFSAAEAWPLAMRAALAEGDIDRAWHMAQRFLAFLDEPSLMALELAPWAVRARLQAVSEAAVAGGHDGRAA